MGRPATDKSQRLIEAAMIRFHHYGVAASSLAAVANDAGVPVGNVFYYFRTKNALTAAVIERWCERVKERLSAVESTGDRLQSVRMFIGDVEVRRQGYADFGCPLAALKGDLRLASPALVGNAGRPVAMIRHWLTDQFEEAGFEAETAQGHADFCLAGLQGSYALAHSTGDPTVVSRSAEHLLGWIDSLAA